MLLWAKWMCQHLNTFHHIPVTNIWGNSGVIFTSLSQRGVIASIASPSWGFSKLLGPTWSKTQSAMIVFRSARRPKKSHLHPCVLHGKPNAEQVATRQKGTSRTSSVGYRVRQQGQICQMQEDFCAYCSVNISKPVIFPVNISKPVFFPHGKKRRRPSPLRHVWLLKTDFKKHRLQAGKRMVLTMVLGIPSH